MALEQLHVAFSDGHDLHELRLIDRQASGYLPLKDVIQTVPGREE